MPSKRISLYRSCSRLALLACACLLTAAAQADPAGRIGRIAWLSGTVNLYNPASGESSDAPRNQPLTSGDILSTGAGARAEIQIGATTVRLDAGSSLNLARIDDERIRLYLNAGRAIVKLPSRDAASDFELATRNGRFSADDAGIFRVDADAGSTVATAYYGTLYFSGNDSELAIGAGQSAQFWHSGQARYRLSSATSDDFSQWSAARDQRPPASTYTRYVSPEMTGAEDLDAYGNWSESVEYGAVWTPRAVASDWAPYRSGHWVWVAPWGWNWVGDEPWGFAPFHYGRWVRFHGAWGWVPGERIARPVYAPAMVAWTAPGFSLTIGARPTGGWFPLAPREVYVPIYRSSENYVRRVNSPHVSRIDNAGAIANNPQGVLEQSHYAHRESPQRPPAGPVGSAFQHRPPESTALQGGDRHPPRNQAFPTAAPAPFDTQTRPERRPDRSGPRQNGAPQAEPEEARPQQRPSRRDETGTRPLPPQVPASTPQRSEPPRPDAVRAAPPAPPSEQRGQERASRRDETAPRPLPPQVPASTPQRSEPPRPDSMRAAPVTQAPAPSVAAPAPQPVRQAQPARIEVTAPVTRQEVPREANRPPAASGEAKPPAHDERQRPATNEDEKKRAHRDDAERRPNP